MTPAELQAAQAFNRVLFNSGLTKAELAKLYGVSRPTIYAWAKGAGPWPGTLAARRVDAITAALCSAIDRKVLPLRAASPEWRAARVAKMTVTLQNLKPAVPKK